MPQELLAFPPYYVVVGVYRLFTDDKLRPAVWAKVKHATLRGLVVAGVYVAATWKIQKWFVENFLMGGFSLFGKRAQAPPVEVLETSLSWLKKADVVDYTTVLFILPQLTSLIHYFLKRNLRIARARAWDLTVQSRGKPAEFWSKGYIEEWEQPPGIGGGEGKGTKGEQQEKWLSWLLFWPSQMALRHFVLFPLSPYLPIYNVAFTSAMRGLYTARVLHRPYFEAKKMTNKEIETWLQERRWGYRAFGFTASLLESIPIIGLGFSVSNRVGAAMWAFDLEKRQHRFANGELHKVRPEDTGLSGTGKVDFPSRHLQEEEIELDDLKRSPGEL
ncbi:hypothetical protein FFLO_03262 [Filobasidium floriforme]|uniref:Uncharacterized protein n=1 Tax=Filobasidium floriforme TaxID=5210 RepID=A0A8K0NQG7_9TREE|nr:hypothetical protein FFLO_03262 [Filobasidium floriforme]